MKKFLMGVIIGVFLMGIANFFLNKDPLMTIELGRFLDKDVVCLKNGKIIEGWISEKNNKEIFIETKDGYFTLPLRNCKYIVENRFFLYLKNAL
jgi:hypothetical protein